MKGIVLRKPRLEVIFLSSSYEVMVFGPMGYLAGLVYSLSKVTEGMLAGKCPLRAARRVPSGNAPFVYLVFP